MSAGLDLGEKVVGDRVAASCYPTFSNPRYTDDALRRGVENISKVLLFVDEQMVRHFNAYHPGEALTEAERAYREAHNARVAALAPEVASLGALRDLHPNFLPHA